MTDPHATGVSRRQFMATATTVAAAVALPRIVTAQKSGSHEVIVGEREYRYRVDHAWPRLPEKFTWQTTHNVAVDRANNLYVIHEGREDQPDHPSIFVFDPDGKFIRAFGNQFQGGGHGLEVRQEGNEEFLYVTAYQALKTFAKLTLDGQTVWQRFAPMDAGVYAQGEDTNPEKIWGRDRFMPTNIAFLDDGGFLVADGYGAYCIHRYDRDANYVATFGGPGKQDGQFELPHGVWIDDRGEGEPKIVVADRVNARLQWFRMDGQHLRTQGGFLLPANVDARGELLLVPDLQARITLLDGENRTVAQLGDDTAWREQVLGNNFALRGQPDNWRDGRFLHPHDACFDAEGNIFVAEWVATGRVSKLTRVS